MADQSITGQGSRPDGIVRQSATWSLALGLFCVLSALIVWQAHTLATRYFEGRLQVSSARTLELYTASLDGLLRKYQVLPELYARDQKLLQLLDRPGDRELVSQANVRLEALNQIAGSMDTYLLDENGLTLAASNWDSAKPFVGRNFSFRPYFQQAIKNGLGRYFALGTTSLKRGYYFASRIWTGSGVKGVIVVKVDLSPLEKIWTRNKDQEIYVTDKHGVIILATNPAWRFRATRPLFPDERAAFRQERKYNNQVIEPVEISSEDYVSSYLLATYPGLTVTSLAAKSKIQAQVWNVVFTVLLLLLALALGVYWLFLRRRIYRRELELHERMNAELEVRVAERTKELRQANARLKHEVVERGRAETDLHKAQDELVRAGKLAALGTLSANVSHELNQPIGAIRTYAENALKMLAAQDIDGPRTNLGLIVGLTDRVGRIVKNLKAFVGQQKRAPVMIDLKPSLHEALQEANSLLTEHDVDVVLDFDGAQEFVHGGKARLMQLFTNLISNAVAAMAGREVKKLTITIERATRDVIVSFLDTGCGFDDEVLSKATEPFYTTKAQADGLGLGLAICENIMSSLDGRVEIANNDVQGARISLVFRRAQDPAMAGRAKAEKVPA